MRGYERIKDLRYDVPVGATNYQGKYYERYAYLHDHSINSYMVIKYKPKGFWTDVITLWVYFKRKDNKVIVNDYKMSNSSGGQDGSLDPIETIDNYMRALRHARNLMVAFKDFECPYEIEEVPQCSV